MVMVVGNHVVGDSRVEKSALTAHRAGYRVTVLGLMHKSVARLDTISRVPILRVAPPYTMHAWWRSVHGEDRIGIYAAAVDGRRQLRRLHSRTSSFQQASLKYRIGSTIRRRSEDARLALARIRRNTLLAISQFRAMLPVSGIWRRAWPYIADLELAYTDAIVDLEPDIVHVHDRHVLPAASTAAEILRAGGATVSWVYDAHEWLPGVDFQGPRVQATAWLAAEAEVINEADAVITVSDQLATMLQTRHRLTSAPFVVTNSPPRVASHDHAKEERFIRDDCGLDQDTDLLVYVGSIAKVRGIETLVTALTMLPEVHLAVIAPRQMKRRLELTRLASDLDVNDRFHILDYVPSSSVASYISSASIGLSPVEPIENYQYSLATKIREYLHAGLPIVASRLRTLADFLEESGVGAVHSPGDASDCARVIKEVLADRASYVDSITEDLLHEHSWERQEDALIGIWGDLIGERPVPRTHTESPTLVVGPVVDKARSWNLLSAVDRETSGHGQLIHREDLVRTTDRLARKVDEYRRIVAMSDGLILEGLQPLFGGLLGATDSQLSHLVAIRPVTFMIDPVAGIDVEELIERIPDCWLRALDDRARKRITSQARRTRRLLNEAGVPALATSPMPMHDLRDFTWLPTVVEAPSREIRDHDGPLQVVIAPGPRAGHDAIVSEALSALADSRVAVIVAQSEGHARSLLPKADVLIDSFGHGFYTDLGAQAMGHRCVVMTRIDPAARAGLAMDCPVIDTSPDMVEDVLAELASNRERLAALSEDAFSYATQVHDGRRSAEIVLKTLGWSS